VGEKDARRGSLWLRLPRSVDIDPDRLGLRRFWSGMGFPAHENENEVSNEFHRLESPSHFWLRLPRCADIDPDRSCLRRFCSNPFNH
jgi:hypothetical protein